MMGYLNRNLVLWERLVFVVFAVMGLSPSRLITTVGAVGVIVTWIILLKMGKKEAQTPAAA